MANGNGSTRIETITSLLKIFLLPSAYFFGYEALQKNFSYENGKALLQKTEEVFSKQLNSLSSFPLVFLEGMRKGISAIEVKDFQEIFKEFYPDLQTVLVMGGAGAASNYLLKGEKAKPFARVTFASAVALLVGYGMITYQGKEPIHLLAIVQKIGMGALGALTIKTVVPPLLNRLNLLEYPSQPPSKKKVPQKRKDE